MCPHEEDATSNQTVFISQIDDPSECVCEEVVIPRIHPIVDEDICLKCDCQYEIRNSWLIKCLVITALIIIGLMTVYLCMLHPILQCYFRYRRTSQSQGYTPLMNEHRTSFRDRLESSQIRWRTTVEQQRQRNLL